MNSRQQPSEPSAEHAPEQTEKSEKPERPEKTVVSPEGFRQTRFVAPEGATTLLLVRHGESAPAVPGEVFPLRDGHGDPPLHPQGRLQAERIGERLRNERIDAIYVSSLQRTHQTAAPLASALGIDPIEMHDLREVFLGDWEGVEVRVRAAANDPIYLQSKREQRWDVIPNAEPAHVFSNRLWESLHAIATAHVGGRVAVFIHGAAIGQILADIVNITGFAFTGADNGSISEIVIDGEVRILRRYNDTAHLTGL
jgi:2,3-bisphosphoglycerate-dependent phosphoglycerate mutase